MADRVEGELIELGSVGGRAVAAVELTRPAVQRLAPLLYGRVAIVPAGEDARSGTAVRFEPDVIAGLIEQRDAARAATARLAAALRTAEAALKNGSSIDERYTAWNEARAALAAHDAAGEGGE